MAPRVNDNIWRPSPAQHISDSSEVVQSLVSQDLKKTQEMDIMTGEVEASETAPITLTAPH